MLAYVIRHAESLTNAGLVAGIDCGLSDLGQRQAAALAARLAAVGVSAIYCSPYRRCIETARPLAERLRLPVFLRPELCEFHHAAPADSLELADVQSLAGRYAFLQPCPLHEGPFDWPTLNEAAEQFHARTRRFADWLKRRWTAEDVAVAVISHGSPTARIIDAWLSDAPGPSFRFIIDNAAVSVLRWHEGVRSLVCLNESSHLAGLETPRLSNFEGEGRVRGRPATGYW